MQDEGSGKRRHIEPQNVRRQQLIDATIQCVARHGITGTTSVRVTAVAGLSVGMINLHFSSKEDLLAAALRHIVAEHQCLWQEGTSNPSLTNAERLLVIVDSHFGADICSPERLSTWYAFFGEAQYRKMYVDIATGADSARQEAVISLCEAIKAEGDYPHADCLQTGMLLEALFDGHWLNMLVYPDKFSAERSGEQIRSFLALTFPEHFKAGPTDETMSPKR